MSDLIDQPLPGFADENTADQLAPVIGFRGRLQPAEPMPATVPAVDDAKSATPTTARAHGKPARHRVRRPGAIGGVDVRAPLLDPTRTQTTESAKRSAGPMHPLVNARRHRIQRAQRRTRLRPLLWPCIFVLTIVAMGLVAFASPVFTVRSVRSQFAGTPAQQADLYRVTASLVGRNMIRLDVVAAEHTIRALPWVAGADVQRDFPNTVVVGVRAHDLAGAVALADGRFALASSDASVVSIVDATDAMMVGLPRVDLGTVPVPAPGDVLRPPASDVLRSVNDAAHRLPGRLASAKLRDGQLTWFVRPLVGTKTIRVLVGPTLGGDIAAAALESVMARSGAAPTAIDLRIPDTPVLELPVKAQRP